VKDKLKRFGLFVQIGEASFFPTIGAAAAAYLESHALESNAVEWTDWEDRAPAAGDTGSRP
jgi:hypothetical protein